MNSFLTQHSYQKCSNVVWRKSMLYMSWTSLIAYVHCIHSLIRPPFERYIVCVLVLNNTLFAFSPVNVCISSSNFSATSSSIRRHRAAVCWAVTWCTSWMSIGYPWCGDRSVQLVVGAGGRYDGDTISSTSTRCWTWVTSNRWLTDVKRDNLSRSRSAAHWRRAGKNTLFTFLCCYERAIIAWLMA